MTLTATASGPIGSDTIKIVDTAPPGTTIMSCPAGQVSCQAPTVTFATPTTHVYEAFIMSGSTVVSEDVLFVAWDAFPVTLSASPTTLSAVPLSLSAGP